jgi:hypothetical protein
MTWSQVADVLRVLQGVGILVLLIAAAGAWRQKQESTPAALAKELASCRAACDRRLDDHDREIEKSRARHHDVASWQEALPAKLDQSYARKETIGAQLEGISVRLANIERALRVNTDEA